MYIEDIVEFGVWENYGQDLELEAIIASLPVDHVNLTVRILGENIREPEAHDLFRLQIEQAQAFWAALLVSHCQLEEFEGLAGKVGSSALGADSSGWSRLPRGPSVATSPLAVFGAANKPGSHLRFLAAECVRVTGKPMPGSKPVLKRVK